jgi:hypothetical protein
MPIGVVVVLTIVVADAFEGIVAIFAYAEPHIGNGGAYPVNQSRRWSRESGSEATDGTAHGTRSVHEKVNVGGTELGGEVQRVTGRLWRPLIRFGEDEVAPGAGTTRGIGSVSGTGWVACTCGKFHQIGHAIVIGISFPGVGWASCFLGVADAVVVAVRIAKVRRAVVIGVDWWSGGVGVAGFVSVADAIIVAVVIEVVGRLIEVGIPSSGAIFLNVGDGIAISIPCGPGGRCARHGTAPRNLALAFACTGVGIHPRAVDLLADILRRASRHYKQYCAGTDNAPNVGEATARR